MEKDKGKIIIDYHKENTHIENSYLLTTRKAIREEVETIIFVREAKRYPVRKHKSSYVNEWKGHNRLYKIGYKQDHTKDVDLEERITPMEKLKGLLMDLIWLIIGGI